MLVITDDKNIVKEISLIPGNVNLPRGWHGYFPVTEKLPNVGELFIPNTDLQPWLKKPEVSMKVVVVMDLDELFSIDNAEEFLRKLKSSARCLGGPIQVNGNDVGNMAWIGTREEVPHLAIDGLDAIRINTDAAK